MSVHRSVAPRHLSSPRIRANTSVSRRSVTTTRTVKGPTGVKQGMVSQRASVTSNRTNAIQKSVLRNRSITGAAKGANKQLARSNFRGQFANKHIGNPQWARFHRRHFFVIGWVGPLFWPYAYDDFIDYTFWPYAYDTFWPYAYDDVYVSLFGPYAYAGSAYASAPAYREGRRVQRVPAGGVAQICSAEGTGLTDWPIEQISQTVEPNDRQRGLLDELKNATANAVEEMRSACPSDLPDTPTGRIAAMRNRLEAMLKAVTLVRPALDRFYGSLSDEQKQRFNAVPEATPTRRRAAARTPEQSQACGADVAAPVPIDRIRRVVEPSEAQASALDALDEATRRAAEELKASCQGEANLTPPGRIAAMEQRLKATLDALDKVQPALDRFYGSLSDEQKARFNRLTRQG
jgi:LTXXQ motif family protein